MSQISINGPFAAQHADAAQPQAVQARPNFRKPEALLARLSGMGKWTSPFNPKLVGQNSYLARTANLFASRPLGNTDAGKAASAMLAFADQLASRPITKEDLATLDALRTKALHTEAAEFCNALARTVLLRPMTDAIAKLSSKDIQAMLGNTQARQSAKEMRTLLADSLHGMVDNLFAAQSQTHLKQAAQELAGMRNTFHTLGILKSEHDVIFMQLNSVFSFRNHVAESLETLRPEVDSIKNGNIPDRPMDEILSDVLNLCERTSGNAETVPALALMGIGTTSNEAMLMALELAGISMEERAAFATRMEGLTQGVRTPGCDLAELKSAAGELKDSINVKANRLRNSDLESLNKLSATLDGAIQTSTLLREANGLILTTGTALSALMEKDGQFNEALAMPGLAYEDKIRLETGKEELGTAIRQKQELAFNEEKRFAEGIRNDLGKIMEEAAYAPLLSAIDERKAALPHAELSEEGRASASATLTELKHQAEVDKFMAHFSSELFHALDQKEGTPTLTELSAELDAAKGKDIGDTKALLESTSNAKALLESISKEHLGELSAFAARQGKAIDDAQKPSGVETFFESMADEAGRFLLPDDKKSFDATLDALIKKHGDAIYTKEAAPQLTGEAFSALSAEHKATLKELCLEAQLHPSLFKMLKAMEATDLEAFLTAFTNIQASRNAHEEPADSDIAAVDKHFLRYPELDDMASAMLRKDGADYRFDSSRMLRDLRAHMEQDFPAALRRSLDLARNDASDIAFLTELVSSAAKARLLDKAKFQQIDFSLIQALWYCKKAQSPELDFASFKNDLPQPYQSMPLLQKYMEAGISGRTALKKLGSSLSFAAQGTGSRWALMGFLTEAQAQNAKWAAGMGVKALSRELNVEDATSLEGKFSNEVKATLTSAKDAVSHGALAGAQAMNARQEKNMEELNVLQEDVTRAEMKSRIGLPKEQDTFTNKGVTTSLAILLLSNIFHMKVTLAQKQALIAHMNFQHMNFADNKINGSDFKIGFSDDLGKEFRDALVSIQNNFDPQKSDGGPVFAAAHAKVLEMLKELNLEKKAEAIIYFKNFKGKDAIGAVKEKLRDSVRFDIHGGEDSGPWHTLRVRNGNSGTTALYDYLEESILGKLNKAGVFSQGQSEGRKGESSTLNFATGHLTTEKLMDGQKSQEVVNKHYSQTLKEALSTYSKAEQERLPKVVALALCEQVARSSEFHTIDDLRQAFAKHKSAPQNWEFYKATLERLTVMGLPESTADLFLSLGLETMEDDFFVNLAKEGQKGVKPKEGIAHLVDAHMAELKEEGKSLTFSRSSTGGLALTTGVAGVADAGVNLKLARENGLTVWKDSGGTYHMTLMDGNKADVAAAIGVEFGKVIKAIGMKAGARAEAGVQANLAHGCDLSFTNAAHCHMFLYALLSHQTCTELLALCKEASLVTEGGFGARVSLSAEAQVAVDSEEALLSAELRADASADITWSRTSNGEHSLRSRTVRGSLALEAEASLNLGVLDETVNAFADSLKGKIAEKVEDVAGKVLPESVAGTVAEKAGQQLDEKSGMALDAFSRAMKEAEEKGEDGILRAEKTRVFSYEETRNIRERNALTSDGKHVLESYERVRAFAPENKAEAIDLMRKHKVSPECISAVLEHLRENDIPATEGFRLELVSSMTDSAIREYNANPKAKIGKGALALTEVRIITEEAYQKERGLERGVATLNINRGLTHTQTTSFDAKLGAYASARKGAGV